MKIAVIRASSLNKWEMQNYEPLLKKHSITAITSTNPGYPTININLPIKRLVCLGDLLAYFPYGIKFLYKYYGDPQLMLGLENEIKNFDIVHSAELGNYYTLQAVKAKEKGFVKKVVVTVWENIPFTFNENPVRKKNKTKVINKVDLFIAVTKAAKDTLIKEGVSPKKIVVIRMGVDLKIFKPTKKNNKLAIKLGIKSDKKIILFVGRLVKEKGIFELFEALTKLKKRDDWQALFIGEGLEKNSLKNLVKKENLESEIKIIPFLQYQKISKYFNLADIFILPSKKTKNWQEQYGMVLVEAMACGKAVIITDGTQKEIIGNSGIVVSTPSSLIIQNALEKLLESPKLMEKMGKLSRIRAEKFFNAEKISKELERAYKKVLLK